MRITVATAVACLLGVGISTAHEAQAAIRKLTTIPAQGLGPALQQLAQESGVQLVYRSELVGDRQTSGAVGELTFDEALTRLLSGTGLMYQYLDDLAITLAPISNTSRASGDNRAPGTTGSSLEGAAVTRTAQPSATGSVVPDAAAAGSLWGQFRVAQLDQGQASKARSEEVYVEKTSTAKLEEVVVTAQRREELLQDVPISISVLTGEDLDRSPVQGQGTTEMLSRVPGLATQVGNQGGGTALSVRGVAANGPLFSGSSPVAYYIDSVPFGLIRTAIFPDPNVYDLERIEVLRGPQGTLYGASALNGVVRVLSKDANLNEFEFKTRGLVSATEMGGDNYRGDMAVNMPIVDGKLAARAMVGYQDLSGWIDRPNRENANDAEVLNMRLKIKAQPSDQLSIGLSAWLSRVDNGGPSIGDDNGQRNALLDESVSTDYDQFGLNIVYDFSNFSVTSSTGYLDYENASDLDILSFGLDSPLLIRTSFDAEIFSQEVNLNSTHGGPWRWSAGGIYRDAKNGLQFGVVPEVSRDVEETSKSFAVFGELTRVFLDGQWELTGGLRYFEDEVGATGVSPPPPFQASDTFDATTSRVVLAWHPSDQTTVYASFAEGFRSGAFQNSEVSAAGFPPVAPDSLKNYEVGAKGSLLSGRIGFDTAFFYIDWQDVQQTIEIPSASTPGLFTPVLINGTSASGIGFEFGLTIEPVDRLTLGATFGWNDLTNDEDVFSGGVLLFAKGERLNYSPEYTAGASADYVFPIGVNGFEARFSASANYTSEMQSSTVSEGVKGTAFGDPMSFVRASFAIDSPNRWTATAFVENANNEQGSYFRAGGAFPDWDERVRPRTIGVQVEYRFK